MPANLTAALSSLQRGGFRVPPAAEAALRRQLAQFTGVLDENTKKQLLQKFLDGLKSIAAPKQVLRPGETQTVTEGATPTSLSSDIHKLLAQYAGGDKIAQLLNLDFKTGVASKVMRNAGHFLTDQTDVDEYPAWELHRIYDRSVPRGFERGPKGSLIPIADDDWPARWADAGAQAGDSDWLPWEGDAQGGRGVALKSSGIWDALGNLREDSLGNPFPPFAFNSGFGCDGVPRKECESLGLLDPGDKAEGADFDFSQLFEIPEVA